MKKHTVRPTSHVGSWRTPVFAHLLNARAGLDELGDTHRQLVAQVEAGLEPDFRLLALRSLHFHSVRLLSLVFVEAFLNFYGSWRLGDEQYHKSLERIPRMDAKLRALLLLCAGQWLEDGDELLTLTNAITEERNALVHPKARETDAKPEPEVRQEGEIMIEQCQAALSKAERFLELFSQADPQSARMAEEILSG